MPRRIPGSLLPVREGLQAPGCVRAVMKASTNCRFNLANLAAISNGVRAADNDVQASSPTSHGVN